MQKTIARILLPLLLFSGIACNSSKDQSISDYEKEVLSTSEQIFAAAEGVKSGFFDSISPKNLGMTYAFWKSLDHLSSSLSSCSGNRCAGIAAIALRSAVIGACAIAYVKTALEIKKLPEKQRISAAAQVITEQTLTTLMLGGIDKIIRNRSFSVALPSGKRLGVNLDPQNNLYFNTLKPIEKDIHFLQRYTFDLKNGLKPKGELFFSNNYHSRPGNEFYLNWEKLAQAAGSNEALAQNLVEGKVKIGSFKPSTNELNPPIIFGGERIVKSPNAKPKPFKKDSKLGEHYLDDKFVKIVNDTPEFFTKHKIAQKFFDSLDTNEIFPGIGKREALRQCITRSTLGEDQLEKLYKTWQIARMTDSFSLDKDNPLAKIVTLGMPDHLLDKPQQDGNKNNLKGAFEECDNIIEKAKNGFVIDSVGSKFFIPSTKTNDNPDGFFFATDLFAKKYDEHGEHRFLFEIKDEKFNTARLEDFLRDLHKHHLVAQKENAQFVLVSRQQIPEQLRNMLVSRGILYWDKTESPTFKMPASTQFSRPFEEKMKFSSYEEVLKVENDMSKMLKAQAFTDMFEQPSTAPDTTFHKFAAASFFAQSRIWQAQKSNSNGDTVPSGDFVGSIFEFARDNKKIFTHSDIAPGSPIPPKPSSDTGTSLAVGAGGITFAAKLAGDAMGSITVGPGGLLFHGETLTEGAALAAVDALVAGVVVAAAVYGGYLIGSGIARNFDRFLYYSKSDALVDVVNCSDEQCKERLHSYSKERDVLLSNLAGIVGEDVNKVLSEPYFKLRGYFLPCWLYSQNMQEVLVTKGQSILRDMGLLVRVDVIPDSETTFQLIMSSEWGNMHKKNVAKHGLGRAFVIAKADMKTYESLAKSIHPLIDRIKNKINEFAGALAKVYDTNQGQAGVVKIDNEMQELYKQLYKLGASVRKAYCMFKASSDMFSMLERSMRKRLQEGYGSTIAYEKYLEKLTPEQQKTIPFYSQRLNALKELAAKEDPIAFRTYKLNTKTTHEIKRLQLETSKLSDCYGTPIQQHIIKEAQALFDRVSNNDKMIVGENQALVDTALKMAYDAVDNVHYGSILSALELLDYAWMYLGFTFNLKALYQL